MSLARVTGTLTGDRSDSARGSPDWRVLGWDEVGGIVDSRGEVGLEPGSLFVITKADQLCLTALLSVCTT